MAKGGAGSTRGLPTDDVITRKALARKAQRHAACAGCQRPLPQRTPWWLAAQATTAYCGNVPEGISRGSGVPQSIVVRAFRVPQMRMKCPACDCHDTRVIDSRETSEMDAVRRRRQCVACAKRFTTYERWERPDLRVVKRDGRVEDFDRDKLEVGVLKACEKRPIPREALTVLIDEVEEELRAMDVAQVPTTEIGSLVLEKLKPLDPVAYLRFASVYRAFQDVSHFEKELRHLRQETLLGPFDKAPEAPAEERGDARAEGPKRRKTSG